MKLVPTTDKVVIQWFAVLHDGTKLRNNKGFIHNAWDVTCSCGWESKTGGAIKSYVKDLAENHKWDAHNYTYSLNDSELVKELNLGAHVRLVK
jgi:hypothetical protein